MSQTFIKELERENLCTHFVLPLLKLNKFSFIVSNFVGSYLDKEGSIIAVQLIEPILIPSFIMKYYNCKGLYTHDNKYYVLYDLPERARRDVRLFMEGKFSKISNQAKEMIVRYSNLNHRELVGKRVLTDGKLLALDKHPLLKLLWENEIGVKFDDSSELLSIPNAKSYIDLNLLKKISQP